MRVVHLVDGFGGEGGGVVTYLLGLFPALAAAGVSSHVISGQAVSVEVAGASCEHVPAIDADVPTLPAATRLQLAAALRAAAPDVCYVHVICPEVVTLAAAVAPVVVYAHEYLTVCPGGGRFLTRRRAFCAEGPGLRCAVRAYTERCTNRRPDRVRNALGRVRAWREAWPDVARVLVASPGVGDILVGSGAPRERVAVVPYPVASPARPAAPAGGADVLYLGRLTSSKGVDVLLEALALLPGVTAVVAGDGPDRAELEALAAGLGLGERVRFTGWVDADAAASLLWSSRVLALPSLWDEPFGIVGLEALGAGLPVVGSAVGGIPSWLEDGVTGLLVPPGDAPALAGALRCSLDGDALARSVAAAAPAVAARFSRERHLESLLGELRAVVAGRRG